MEPVNEENIGQANVMLDHGEAQRLLNADRERYGNEDFVILTQVDEEPEGLEGEPLTLKEVKKLCPNHFVRDSLFRISGRAKETAPLKLSDLQHVDLAKVLLQRFIQKERSLPNNNQVAIYFVQQCFVQDILRRRVNWNDKPANAGVGLGRISQKRAANLTNAPLPPRKKPMVLTPEEHQRVVDLASQGATLATQGHTVESLLLTVNQLEANIAAITTDLARKE